VTAATIDPPVDLGALWRRWRMPAAVAAVLLVAAIVLAIIENAPPTRPLDPADPSHQGGRALAQLVRDRGVDVVAVRDVTTATITAGTTVFVPDPTSLTRDDLSYLSRQAASLVVVGPGRRELRALGLVAAAAPGPGEGKPSPDCAFAPAAVAGTVHFDGRAYDAPGATSQCYPSGIATGLFVSRSAGHRVVVFGSPRTLTNDWLDDEGDAALGLGLLTTTPRLVWVVPRPPAFAPADTRHRGLFDLLPPRLLWATLQLFLAVVLLALWRARRVGPVVVEPLPVVVRATETVEGRARLLRAARARGAAAAALRNASIERLRDRLGLPADATQAAAVESVARRSGWNATDVDRTLYGPPPEDDATLLRLTSELDQLDRIVRRS
jgi:Domain of unknown function (DUF4350)